jgi:hypothetical protein
MTMGEASLWIGDSTGNIFELAIPPQQERRLVDSRRADQ